MTLQRVLSAAVRVLALTSFLSAAPIQAALHITEFLARNDGGLRDADGESPDWIELYNDGPEAVDLAGWHLTDSAANLTKWTFPATNLAAGSYLVVFASGKDRAMSGGELHTSFKLDENGGYLALVQPDGITVVHSFDYPAQRANVSTGPGDILIGLLPADAPARVFVPVDGGLGLDWTAPGFNDSDWLGSNAPVGFSLAVNALPVLALDINERGQDPAAITMPGFQSFVLNSNVSSTAIQTQATTRVYGAYSVTLSNTAPLGCDDRLRAAPLNAGSFTESLLLRDFIFSRDDTGTGGLDVWVSGLAPGRSHQITLWSYDNGSPGLRVSDWSANGVLQTNNYAFDGGVLPSSDAQYRIGFETTADENGRIRIAGRRDPSSSVFGVFLNAIRVSEFGVSEPPQGLAALMVSNNASVYLRQRFVITDPSGISLLKLRIRYDDGFVAYLNGQRVVARNAPALPAWNSAATSLHATNVSEEIPFLASPGLLVAGENTLAFHGLNRSPGDPDFAIAPELFYNRFTATNRYFPATTPGTNNGFGFAGLVADTKFSVNRGFYDTPFTVAITSATAGATIRWTTNGDTPSAFVGNLYDSPIPIAGTTLLRAVAVQPGAVPSDVDTHTYLFLPQVLEQPSAPPGYPAIWQGNYPADYGMDPAVVNNPVYGPALSNALRRIPTLSIVSDANGLWGDAFGIYPNATSSGPGWERPASLELIDGAGGTLFAVNAKIEMHGNASRDNARTPKHSIRATFNSSYGPTRLRHEWFKEPGSDEHDKIILRSCGFVDGWAGRYADPSVYISTETGESFRGLRYRPENTCYLRDAWVKESFRDMGWLASRSEFVHLYLNGLYWGLYQPSEAIDASYFARTVGGPEESWDVLVGEDNGGQPVVVDGTAAGWQNVLNLVNANIGTDAAYQAVAQQIDIDNLIDYMLLHVFAESEDWPHHNWYVARRRATVGFPGTKFICMVWDQELTLDRLVRRNRINVGTTGSEIYGPARVYAQLRAWPEFRRQFGDRVQQHLFNGGALTPERTVRRLLNLADRIRPALAGESARWGDAREFAIGANPGTGQTFTPNEWWQPEIDKLATNFLQKLTADNVARFRTALLYPTLGAPVLGAAGGAVAAGFSLSLSNPNPAGVIYFTTDQSDPRVYGTGASAPSAATYSVPIPILTPTTVRARVLNGTSWSALVSATYYPPQDLSRLALTEVMYNPPAIGATNGDEFEFLELQNAGSAALDLSGLTFTSGITFTFTNGTTLAPGAFVVLARNAGAFAAKYPGVPVHGVFTGRLDNGGERITLAEPAGGAAILSINYDDEAPWPLAPDNYGFSMVPKAPGTAQAPDNGRAWRASADPGGSPGATDPSRAIPAVVINEILPASTPPDVDRIELFNPTAETVDVGGWLLTDDHSVPGKFRIPPNTILEPGGYATFAEPQFNPAPGIGPGFALSSLGESLYLFSADAATNLTGYSHGFIYDAAAPGVSFGRHLNSVGDESFPAQIATTFGAPNAGPRTGPIVIREIHYNPAPGGDEFLELANITGSPVPLFDPANPTNTWRVSGIGYSFPTNITLPPGGVLVLVATNPAVFRTKYAVPAEAIVIGPFAGDLQNSGERLRIERPASPGTNGVAYIVVDDVRYNDKAPWPSAADGAGPSLQRTNAATFGDDPAHWRAGVPTPGTDFVNGDADADGLPDDWEIENGTNPLANDAAEDPDDDGLTNGEEFLAGTHPNQPASALRVAARIAENGQIELTFERVPGRGYRVLYKDSLGDLAWLPLETIPPSDSPGTVVVIDPNPTSTRFYQVVTP